MDMVYIKGNRSNKIYMGIVKYVKLLRAGNITNTLENKPIFISKKKRF